MFSQGEQYKFGLYLNLKYGEGTAKELELKARQIKNFKQDQRINKDLFELALEYVK